MAKETEHQPGCLWDHYRADLRKCTCAKAGEDIVAHEPLFAHPARMPTREEIEALPVVGVARRRPHWTFWAPHYGPPVEAEGYETDSLVRLSEVLALFHTGETKGDGQPKCSCDTGRGPLLDCPICYGDP